MSKIKLRRVSALARQGIRDLYSPPYLLTLSYTFALAYGGGFWLHFLHESEGGHEQGALLPVLHWLRDSSLMLPAVFAAVWLSIAIVGRIYRPGPGAGSPFNSLRAWAGLTYAVSFAASLVMAGGAPVHSFLFGASHGGVEHLPFYLHFMRDGLLALFGNLAVAAGLTFLYLAQLRLAAWWSKESGRMPNRAKHGGPVAALLLSLLASLLPAAEVEAAKGSGSSLAAVTTRASSAGSPCPPSALVRRFDVLAIDVNIPLNRFGDHDPVGKMYVLASKLAAVRAEEATQQVSIGLADDAIQPLVIRANLGDCVEINFTNNASGMTSNGQNVTNISASEYGIHIDGLSYEIGSSGDAIGQNPFSSVTRNGTSLYRYYIPNDVTLEGAHYLHPGPGNREATSHGLFGALVVEPAGSTYLKPDGEVITNPQLDSGWERTILPGSSGKGPAKAFREGVKLFHEIGNERFEISTKTAGETLPLIDPITDAYRPGSRAINYRSEPFMHRLKAGEHQKSLAYNSYTFGDPATPMPRSYVGDPTKFRILHAGTEVFHVYHLHGGGIRWRSNPHADHTYEYDQTSLQKHPKTAESPSSRLDSQSFGPGEAYDLQIEGGAGGVQHAVGDLLFHCHIAHHYNSGMWSVWRVFNTLQVDFAPLPDQNLPPEPVDSTGLLGKTMPDGTVLTAENLANWLKPQLPPMGLPKSDQDASVWNWTITDTPGGPLYLGEPEDKTNWPNLRLGEAHPGGMPGDQYVGTRPKILFNPLLGRPAYPLLRPHIGKRAPFSGNGHMGSPYLGNNAELPKPAGATAPEDTNPWLKRPDGVCPATNRDGVTPTTRRKFNITSVEVPVKVTEAGATDSNALIFVLNKDKADLLSGKKPVEPLALRGNNGDCISLTYVTEWTDKNAFGGFAKSNIHIHHVQFDPQGSDGASAGYAYDQSIRPYRIEDPTLTAPIAVGEKTLALSKVTKFQPGVWIGLELGTDNIEIRQIETITVTNQATGAGTVTLTKPVSINHPAGSWAGTEYMQYQWYPDVELDNIFWHDHVDGIHGWGKGAVGQFIVEPTGSTYHDPRTGKEVDSGTIVDIRTPSGTPGLVGGSYREMALWTIDDNPANESTLNLRAAPWADRLKVDPDPSLILSSYRHGDPNTPLPRAYPGDPFVIRTVNVSGGVDTFHIDGHRFFWENRYKDLDGKVEASPIDTFHYGVSERFTLILEGGASQTPGDYLYMNGIGKRFRQGAWGMLRVLPGQVTNDPDDPNFLLPLPGRPAPATGVSLPAKTSARPPEVSSQGNVCPGGAPQRNFDISVVSGVPGAALAYVPTAKAADIKSGKAPAEPLVLHVAAGECLNVKLTNDAASGQARASFHLSKLVQDINSAGANVGFNPEQTVGPGQSRNYRFYVDKANLGSTVISDFGGNPLTLSATGALVGATDTGPRGLYGALVVAPAGATFTDPLTGAPKDVGTQVDVHVPGGKGYRDFTLAFAETDDKIGQDDMPYPTEVSGNALINYKSAPLKEGDTGKAFSFTPPTPLLQAYAGDPVRVHALVTPGSEQVHVLNLGGYSWSYDAAIEKGTSGENRAFGPWQTLDAVIVGGAGGQQRMVGDSFYGDMRRPFTQAGMWGLMRTLADPTCPIKPLDGLSCLGLPSLNGDPIAPVVAASPGEGSFSGPASVSLAGSEPVRMYYTTDGSTPTNASPAVSGPVTVDKTLTLKVLAVDRAGNESVKSFNYTIASSAPVAQTCNVTVPALEAGWGYYYVFNTQASGPVNVTWTLPGSLGAQLALYKGNPYSGQSNPSKVSPRSGTLVQDSGTKSTFKVTTSSLAAGQYTAYFYSKDKGLVTTPTSGKATFVTTNCGK